jgi:hypothetical protein
MQLSRSLIARIVAFLRLALNQADPVFLTPVTHQITQFTDREVKVGVASSLIWAKKGHFHNRL